MDEEPTGAVSSRLYPDRPILAASLAVFRDGRVLLAQRAASPSVGRFTLPGGMVETGESLEEAALRETLEEVGVTARIVGFNRHVEIVERDTDGRVKHHYVVASFVGTWVAGEAVVGPEAAAVAWVKRDEVAALPVTEHLLPLLDRAWIIADAQNQPC